MCSECDCVSHTSGRFGAFVHLLSRDFLAGARGSHACWLPQEGPIISVRFVARADASIKERTNTCMYNRGRRSTLFPYLVIYVVVVSFHCPFGFADVHGISGTIVLQIGRWTVKLFARPLQVIW